jgi:hypothetical protein
MGTIVACVGDDPAASGTPADNDAGMSSSGGSSSGGSSSGGSSSGGIVDAGPDATLDPDAAPPLGCPLGCLPPAPMDWIGPSAVYDGTTASKPTSCPALYTQQELATHRDMTAGPATCTCPTGTVVGAKCTATARVYTVSSAGCTTKAGFNNVALDSTMCTAAVGTSTDAFVLAPTVASVGTCSYATPTPVKPAPTFGTETVSCGLPQAAASCENRADCVATPVPDAPFTRLCIHKDGDVLCPSADYSVRLLTYKSIDDQRGCASTCAGTPTGAGTCGTGWGFDTAGSKTCTTDAPPTGNTAAVTCGAVPSAKSVINPKGLAPTGITCTPSAGSSPNGAATSIDPVTFCCNK